jgi:uncharacterized protein (TIGR00369 family)
LPRAAATLGLELVSADADKGTIDLTFTATEDFTTPTGEVLGGFLAAMLYDTVGPALLATLEPDQFISTIERKTSFLQPAYPGRILGHGRVVYRDGDLAFLEAWLTSPDGETIATATATLRVIAVEPAATGVLGRIPFPKSTRSGSMTGIGDLRSEKSHASEEKTFASS